MRARLAVVLAAVALSFACERPAPPPAPDFTGPVADWPDYGGGEGARAWSPLTQLTPANVSALTLAWEHHSGDGELALDAFVELAREMVASPSLLEPVVEWLSSSKAESSHLLGRKLG